MIYFASDLHLGAPYIDDARAHEQRIVQWLDSIRHDAEALYLLGDIFDYWYEYTTVIPKGFTRFLGKVAELTDAGVEVHFFTGNHDVWMFDYLPAELGVAVHDGELECELHGQHFLLGHGDDVGFDRPYHWLKAFFHNRVAQFLYGWVHPDLTMRFAHWWSRRSRMGHDTDLARPDHTERPVDDEWQVKYARQRHAAGCPAQWFLFGHRHLVIDQPAGDNTRVLVIGDWLRNFSYAQFDGQTVSLHRWNN